ncbi:MAG TPA: c-type cytochrome [Crenotrichaceae bacterium]|nr:c-type cytochrome [Crenotrichaceae bacterium]
MLSISYVSANEVFTKYCSSCHNNGGNLMNPKKTLSQKDLAANGVDNAGSISALITNGKPPMPAFGKDLSDEEIAGVAKFVLDQAAAGWK